MWVVVDWHYTQCFGPFSTEDEAKEWLARQHGIYEDQYDDIEVAVIKLKPLTASLLELNA